ncbi:MAG: indolepyruvate oxidoreductase subunit beta [Theionarchaea archaeon]|nr:indolepyruvate oxidoreductase subunit beta [Theionarchaea archaeon]
MLKDPYNIIITGVGGQGNVTASRILGNMLIDKYFITIGETFGASQRGGPVMSHIRVSQESVWSPQIPKGKADCIAALEPAEALRVLGGYGNPDTVVVCNMRPVYSLGVITGEWSYPPLEEIEKAIRDFTDKVWFLNATDIAVRLGNPLLGNMVIIGALAGLEVLPLNQESFVKAVLRQFPEDTVEVNVKAFEIGREMIKNDSELKIDT